MSFRIRLLKMVCHYIKVAWMCWLCSCIVETLAKDHSKITTWPIVGLMWGVYALMTYAVEESKDAN